MKVTLSNHLLTVEIDTHGAELQSIKNNRTQQEYLWQGDKAFWGRRSPILFPIVGSVWNGTYRMDNSTYAMSQHGFARDCDFELLDSYAEDEFSFALESNETTMALYPRHFRLEIGYKLQGEKLFVMWLVRNTGNKTMDFQIGAHPAFNYSGFNAADAVHGYFELGCRHVRVQQIECQGCVGAAETEITFPDSGLLPLSAATFAHDALILPDAQLHRVSMLDKDFAPYLTLLFQSPVVGLWSPPAGNAPFVCIEPWWGRCDRVGFSGEFSDREYINTLVPGAEFRAGYTIIIDNL